MHVLLSYNCVLTVVKYTDMLCVCLFESFARLIGPTYCCRCMMQISSTIIDNKYILHLDSYCQLITNPTEMKRHLLAYL